MTPDEIDDTWDHATRIGTFALLVFAITSFLSSILLPLIVAPSYNSPLIQNAASKSASQRPSMLNRFIIPWLTLRRAWLLSLIFYALVIFLTVFVTTPTGGTILVGLIGIPWAVTLWAPFALIAGEISKRDALRRLQHSRPRTSPGSSSSAATAVPVIDDGCEDQAGIILGLHNVAIAAPQIISTLGSSLVFRALQRPRGTPGDDSVGWVLRIGAVASLVGAFMATRVGEERDGIMPGKVPEDEERGRGTDRPEATVRLLSGSSNP
jgi:solute carrier family 45 protein 1/2/4